MSMGVEMYVLSGEIYNGNGLAVCLMGKSEIHERPPYLLVNSSLDIVHFVLLIFFLIGYVWISPSYLDDCRYGSAFPTYAFDNSHRKFLLLSNLGSRDVSLLLAHTVHNI